MVEIRNSKTEKRIDDTENMSEKNDKKMNKINHPKVPAKTLAD